MRNMTPQTQERFAPRKRKTRWCHIDGCVRFTQNDKPFCSGHVENHPYVQDLLHQISERKDEEARTKRWGWKSIDIDGPIAKDTVLFLRIHGERTVARLAKNLNRDFYIQSQYVHALFKAGLVGVRNNSRGNLIVKAS